MYDGESTLAYSPGLGYACDSSYEAPSTPLFWDISMGGLFVCVGVCVGSVVICVKARAMCGCDMGLFIYKMFVNEQVYDDMCVCTHTSLYFCA